MSLCRQTMMKNSLRRIYGRNVNIVAVRYMGHGHNEPGFLPDHDTMDEFMRIPMREACDQVKAMSDEETLRAMEAARPAQTNLYAFGEEEEARNEKQMNMWKYLSLACFPGIFWLYFKIRRDEQQIHDSYHTPMRDLPYKKIMKKRFPWKDGDKCSLLDPHCYAELKNGGHH